MDDFWIRLDQLDEGRSKPTVPSRELDSQGGENRLEGPPVLEVSGAKEGGTQPPVCKHPLRDRLCDGALARPSEPVQPIDRGFVGITGPQFDLVQDRRARSSETTISIAMSIPGLSGGPHIVDDSSFGCRRMFFQAIVGNARTEGDLTCVLQKEVILCAQMYMRHLLSV